jgi:hypothetical protein
MNVKEDFLSMGNFNIHDGRQIRFGGGLMARYHTFKTTISEFI